MGIYDVNLISRLTVTVIGYAAVLLITIAIPDPSDSFWHQILLTCLFSREGCCRSKIHTPAAIHAGK